MISLVASPSYPALGPDDGSLLDALARRDMPYRIDPWDAEGVDWPSFAAVVMRAPWDYYERIEEFSSWVAARAADATRMWNPAEIIAWNMRKTYLRDLAERGVTVVETEWLRPEDDARAVMDRRGWTKAVLKPVVSAGGWRTKLLEDAHATAEPVSIEMMLQPFLEQIVVEGEWSFVFFGGRFSHAFVKRPASENFLVQERHGGSVFAAEPPPGLLASAASVLEHVPGDLLYARVDGVRDGHRLLLIELEIFEPVLYLGTAEGSADRFVTALLARM